MNKKSLFLKSTKLAIAGIVLTSGLSACSMFGEKHKCSKNSCSTKEAKSSCSSKETKSSCSSKKSK